MNTSNVVKLYQDPSVVPMQGGNVAQFTAIDYDRLAEAILAKQEEQKSRRRAARAASSAEKHSKRGLNGTVDPIRDKQDIIRIAQYFADRGQYRNELMFLIGCSVGLRGSDLSRLRVGDFEPPRYQATIKEQKTGKLRTITLNKMGVEAYKHLVQTLPDCDETTFLS